MQRNLIAAIAAVLLFIHLTSCKKHYEVLYTFDIIPDRVWCGEDLWTAPLEGWRINNGRLEFISNIQQC